MQVVEFQYGSYGLILGGGYLVRSWKICLRFFLTKEDTDLGSGKTLSAIIYLTNIFRQEIEMSCSFFSFRHEGQLQG